MLNIKYPVKTTNRLRKKMFGGLAINHFKRSEAALDKRYFRLQTKNHPILKGFLGQLFKNNSALIKLTRPLLFSVLKGSSNPFGFKKLLYNRVKIQNHRLTPSFNRRKHSHSHYIIVTNQLRKLSKSFNYLAKNKLKNFITFALKKAFDNKQNSGTITRYKRLLNNAPVNIRPIPNLISLLEAQTTTLLWRNQFNHSLARSRQNVIHNNTEAFLKNNTVLVLKKKPTFYKTRG